MLFTVYILYSEAHEKIYIGYTSNLLQRFYSHNEFGKKGWTKSFRPWKVIFTEIFETKQEALKREKELKSSASRQIIWNKIQSEYQSQGFVSLSKWLSG